MESRPLPGCVADGCSAGWIEKTVGNWYSPRFAGSELVQFWFASFTVVILWSSCLIGDAYAKTVLPNMTLIALDEETIRGISLIIITALVLLVATDASRDLIFL